MGGHSKEVGSGVNVEALFGHGGIVHAGKACVRISFLRLGIWESGKKLRGI